MSRMSKVFAVDRQAFSLTGGIAIGGVLLVIWLTIAQLHQQKYLVTIVFAVLTTALSDPGGGFGSRIRAMGVFGARRGVDDCSGVLRGHPGVRDCGAHTLRRHIAGRIGCQVWTASVHRRVIAQCLVRPRRRPPDQLPGRSDSTNGWHQAIAWLVGSAVWISLTCILWLVKRRKWNPAPIIDVPGEPGAPVPLTRPIVLFALIRASALAASAAIAFGLHEPNADWMVIATLIAMKPSLEQSSLVGLQRVFGAAMGAAVAIPILLVVHDKVALEATIILLAAIGASIHGVNYAYYTAAIASAALIAADIPHPTNYAAEGRRVLFTFIGVGIGVLVMFIADRMKKRQTAAAPPSA